MDSANQAIQWLKNHPDAVEYMRENFKSEIELGRDTARAADHATDHPVFLEQIPDFDDDDGAQAEFIHMVETMLIVFYG